MKNLVAEGKLDDAYAYARSRLMNLRHYQDAVDAGLKLRKEKSREGNKTEVR